MEDTMRTGENCLNTCDTYFFSLIINSSFNLVRFIKVIKQKAWKVYETNYSKQQKFFKSAERIERVLVHVIVHSSKLKLLVNN